MSDMIWTTKSESWYDSIEEVHYPQKTVTIEIDAEEMSWGSLLSEFFHYLNASGYIIDATLIPEMVSSCEEMHKVHWYEKNTTITVKEVNNDSV